MFPLRLSFVLVQASINWRFVNRTGLRIGPPGSFLRVRSEAFDVPTPSTMQAFTVASSVVLSSTAVPLMRGGASVHVYPSMSYHVHKRQFWFHWEMRQSIQF